MRKAILITFALAVLAGSSAPTAGATQPLCPQAQAQTVVSLQGANNGQLICAA